MTFGSRASAPASASPAFVAWSRATASAASTAPFGGRQLPGAVAAGGVERAAQHLGELAARAERVDHRQRVDALDEVLPGGLPEGLVGGGDIEAVVDDLEAQPEVLAVAGEGVERRLVDAADHPADAARRAEQRGGLPLDRRRVVLFRPGHVEQVLQLEHLPAAQLTDRVGEQPGDIGTERRRERRGAGEEEVAREDRDDVAPARVDAGDTAPRLGLVDHVVVVERAEMDELARHAAGHDVVADGFVAPRRRVSGTQGEGRPDPLAARGDQVRSDLGEEPVVVADRGPQCVLDPLEVTVERRERERLGRIHGNNATARPPGSPTRTDRPESGRNGPFRRSHPTRGARRWVCTAQRRTRRHLLD